MLSQLNFRSPECAIDKGSRILTGQNRARTQQLLNREHSIRVGSRSAYWYRTLLRLTRPQQAGTLSVLKGDTLVLIAVRQSSNPQATARQAMMAILPHL